MKRSAIIIWMILFLSLLWGQSVDITQIENRRLLMDGTLDLFFLPRDGEGVPRSLSSDDTVRLFSLSPDGSRTEEKILSMEQQAPRKQGINFLLLIDNSGSMHDEYLDGAPRYATARFAVEQFLQEIDNPLDKVGLSAFNTYYTPLMPVEPIAPGHLAALENITPPDQSSSFTELYRSILESAADLAVFQGRRAIIVLSDGENYPFTLSGSPHPDYGEATVTPDEVKQALMAEGISVYAVHIGDKRDPLLDSIAVETGGRSFSADNREHLKNVYSTIRSEIRQEYRLRFRPPFTDTDINSLVLAVGDDESTARYFIPHFLGEPSGGIAWWYFIPLLLALLLLVLLLVFVWEKPAQDAEINLLLPGRNFSPSTRVNLTGEVTIIGSGERADMTIAGNPGLRESHATIVFDKNSGTYTVNADTEFRVNNRLTHRHTLRSGDVVDFEGTTIVFDKPARKPE